ncbi:CidA/LrgA family protein [Ruminiclostridium herbifermentans]|uniref:CidA/LrgA family protein n=1 Tax=Ruminiclostridium herbifermentans TaxID=2488810 RepID=A0A4U7JM26_9FIRM|nr:CidA/LrgA family protein [Ruminiclostridium herbifermentans]QNU68173.1 CidA/LrgA family protein [Ruminiclostridium herbifermentans]
MKFLRQFLIILIICVVGEVLNRVVHIPLPGSIIGMILLFICLLFGLIKLEMIEEISKFLLDHLAFFFIPAGVGLIAYAGIIKENLLPILVICFATTFLVMVITGWTVQAIKGKINK